MADGLGRQITARAASERFWPPTAKGPRNTRQRLECGDGAKRSRRFPFAPQRNCAWAGRCASAKAPARAGALQTLRALEARRRADPTTGSRVQACPAGQLAANASSQLRRDWRGSRLVAQVKPRIVGSCLTRRTSHFAPPRIATPTPPGRRGTAPVSGYQGARELAPAFGVR